MRTRLFSVMVAGLALSACAATIPPAQVTRFHLDSPIAPGSYTLAGGDGTLEAGTYREAVAAQLVRLGFTTGADTSRYVVTVTPSREERAAAARQSPISIGIGGGTGGYGGGVGIGASFPIGKATARTDVIMKIAVRLSERASGATIWEGRAETVAPSTSPAAQPGLAAQKLASALFKDFPGVSGRTITVP